MKAASVLFACLTAIALQGGAIISAAASNDVHVSAWLLKQEITGWGKQDILFNDRAVRVDDSLRHYTMLARAPDWTVTYFSTERKRISSQPYAQYDGGLARRLAVISTALAGSENLSKITGWERQGQQLYCDHSCDVWALPKKLALARQMASYKMMEAPDLCKASQVSIILAKQISVPSFGRPCVFFQRGNNKPSILLQTLSIKKVSVPLSRFEIPKNYAATTPEKVMFDRQEFDF